MQKCFTFKRVFRRRNMSISFSTSNRATFEELTAGADKAQLNFMKEMVIQVDEEDRVLGPISKKNAHFHDGILHRAFSVFLFNTKNELMLQKRSIEKITFPQHWANTCCSHPLFVQDEMEIGRGVKKAAIRKLEHELGIAIDTFSIADFKYIGSVLYKAASDPNWTEYEMDHILIARKDVQVNMNVNEVEAYEFITPSTLQDVLNDSNRKISPWFQMIASSLLLNWWENLDTILFESDKANVIHDFRSK